jgi:hypothetical protein
MDDPVHPIEPFADVPEREQPNSLSLVVVSRGANRLRAGWRLLIFFAILATLSRISPWIGRAMGRSHWLENQVVRHGLLASAAWWVTHTRAFAFAVVLIATWIMGRIEGRRVADYGLNFPNAFRKKFWQGAAIGLAAITALLGVMHAIGNFNLGATGLHGADVEVRHPVGSRFSFCGIVRRIALPRLCSIYADKRHRLLVGRGPYIRLVRLCSLR